MQVSVPANVVFFKDIILQIVNFQVVDKQDAYDYVTENILGIEDIGFQETTIDDDRSSNIFRESIIVIIIIAILIALIGFIVLC